MKAISASLVLIFFFLSCATERKAEADSDGTSTEIYSSEYSSDDCDKFLDAYEAYAKDVIYLAENADRIDSDPELQQLAAKLDEPDGSKWPQNISKCDSPQFKERSDAITEKVVAAMMQIKNN